MAEINKTSSNKFKVIKIEIGYFEYNTIFIEVEEDIVQIPILKSIVKDTNIIGKFIVVPCIIKDNKYTFNSEISEIKFA